MEIEGEGLLLEGGMIMIGNYSQSGANFTMTLASVETTGVFGLVSTEEDFDESVTGTWVRNGNTLTLTHDDGVVTVLKKK